MPFLIFASERFRTFNPFQRFFTSKEEKPSLKLNSSLKIPGQGSTCSTSFLISLFFSSFSLTETAGASRNSFSKRRNRSGGHFSTPFFLQHHPAGKTATDKTGAMADAEKSRAKISNAKTKNGGKSEFFFRLSPDGSNFCHFQTGA